MTTDGVYWFFSSSAQAIAAFLALLLTGFALILSLMESALRRDDTLSEVHTSLRARHYRGVKITAALLMTAVLMSLSIVALRAWGVTLPDFAHLAVLVLVLFSLAFGTVFVVGIVDPSKYEKAARRLLSEERPVDAAGTTAQVGDFMACFIAIETRLRRMAEDTGLYAPSQVESRFQNLQAIVTSLRRAGYIDADVEQALHTLSRYRNLVAHGQVSTVDSLMLESAQKTLERISSTTTPNLSPQKVPVPSGVHHGPLVF